MNKKIKVLFDFHAFHNQRFGGISRYFYEIISRMEHVHSDVALRFSMNQYIEGQNVVSYVAMPKLLFKLGEGIFRKANRHYSIQKIKEGQFDVFHATYYDPYFLKFIGERPFVLTIHDMTHEMYPEYFSPTDPTASNKRLLAHRASRIIAISEYTKSKIIEILGIDEAKIDVIYHGIDSRPLATERFNSLPRHYVLYVGERRRYKNFELMAKAFAELMKEKPDFNLVLTGRRLSASEKELFVQLGIKDHVKVYSDISDAQLDQLYHHAAVFVYPSLCEGFGIPILEAFAQDCPVVLSRASCFPEVGGDACEYFDTHSMPDLLDVMKRVIEDSDLRHRLIERGRERLKIFRWENTALQTEETYRKIV